jgi:hypothetical protein
MEADLRSGVCKRCCNQPNSITVGRIRGYACNSFSFWWESRRCEPLLSRRLQRRSKALAWCNYEPSSQQALLALCDGTACRFNRYDERCKSVFGKVQAASASRGSSRRTVRKIGGDTSFSCAEAYKIIPNPLPYQNALREDGTVYVLPDANQVPYLSPQGHRCLSLHHGVQQGGGCFYAPDG